MCSNRWANPLRPGTSSPLPTWYQTLTATSGTLWSGARITSSPFGSLYFSTSMRGSPPAWARAASPATSATTKSMRYLIGRNLSSRAGHLSGSAQLRDRRIAEHSPSMRFVLVLMLVAAACGPHNYTYPYKDEPDPRNKELILGVGDVVGVNVWDSPGVNTDATIRPDGTITMPLVGDVKAAGRTPSELREAIKTQLRTSSSSTPATRSRSRSARGRATASRSTARSPRPASSRPTTTSPSTTRSPWPAA